MYIYTSRSHLLSGFIVEKLASHKNILKHEALVKRYIHLEFEERHKLREGCEPPC